MSKTIDAMNQTLEELERYQTKRQDDRFADAIAKLRAAIAREEAQTVEPAFYVPPERNECHGRGFVSASRTKKAGWVPLFTRPAPATETVKPPENCGTGHCSCIECAKPAKPSAGEREGTISSLKHSVAILNEYGLTCTSELVNKAANMLAADALELEHTRKMYEQAVQGRADFRQALREVRKVAVPQGWALVPMEPTSGMWAQIPGNITCGEWVTQYKAMLAAAPQPPQAAPRGPMTEHQTGFAVMEHLGLQCLTHEKISILDAFHRGITAAEQFHGIGVKS